MTSASELFHTRRYRIGRNDPELGFGSSSSFDRSLPLPIHHHNRRHSRHHQRRGEIEDCDCVRRPSSHSRHLGHREHESVRFDHGAATQFNTGNSSGSSSSNRGNRMQFGRSGPLPGDVLLARERLVERLRGVSLSSNSNRLVDEGDWEMETSDITPPISEPSFPNFSTKRPPGLKGEELNHLHREVFTLKEMSEVVLECSICLDSFQKGDELICLPCRHKFHLVCLYPWVRTCGDCPNCRAPVIMKEEAYSTSP